MSMPMDSLLLAIDPAVHWVAARLLAGSLQGALLVAVVWLLCRVFVATPPRARAMLWWIVALKLVLVFAPMPSVPLRVLAPPQRDVADAAPVARDEDGRPGTMPATSRAFVEARPVTGEAAPDTAVEDLTTAPPQWPWLDAAIVVWFAVVAVHALQLLAAHRRIVRLVRHAEPVPIGESRAAAVLARRVGLRRAPAVLVSDGVTSPQAVGVWRPRVLLPVAFADLVTPAEWQMALCHELIHLRRRDLMWGWVPALAERLFFFHPLARLASEQYLLAREAACDAAVLQSLDVEAHEYGRMLLRLGLSRTTPGFAVSGASPNASLLRRRLEMLQHTAVTAGTSRAHWLVAAAVIVLIPFHLAAKAPVPAPPRALPAVTPVMASTSAVVSDVTDATPQPDQLGAPARQKTVAQSAKGDAAASQELEGRQRENERERDETVRAAQELQSLLEQRYEPQHPDRVAVSRLLAELRESPSLGSIRQELEGLQAQLQNASRGLNRVPIDAQLNEAMERVRNEVEQALGSVAHDLELKSLTAQLEALQAQREARSRSTTPSSPQTAQSLDDQIREARQRLEELQVKRRAAIRSGAGTPRSRVEDGERRPAERVRSATIERARASVEREKQRLQEAQRRLTEAEARLRETEQRLERENQPR